MYRVTSTLGSLKRQASLCGSWTRPTAACSKVSPQELDLTLLGLGGMLFSRPPPSSISLVELKDEEASQQVEKVQELAKGEKAASIAKDKASHIEQIAEVKFSIHALCMAFYARSVEAQQSHSVHKLALGTLALEEALSSGSPIWTEVDLLRKSLEGGDKELALSSLPEDVLEYGSDTRMELKQKGDPTKGMGHRKLAAGTSFVRRMPFGTQKRAFCSLRQKAPVIRQLGLNDDYEIKKEKWFLVAECLARGELIFKPISPVGLMRPEDVKTCGNYEIDTFGVLFLRQAIGIVTVNMMRGRNVRKLMNLNNLLWSPERQILMFKDIDLADDDEDDGCPYRAVYDSFERAVELSLGVNLKHLPFPLPVQLKHLLDYLCDAPITDKRLITNHSVILFPGERIQKNVMMNHVTRVRLPYEFETSGIQASLAVFAALGEIFPESLLTEDGLHPAIDHWARTAAENRGEFLLFPNAKSPVMKPLSARGNVLKGRLRKIALGRILMALMRDPFAHPLGPAYNVVEFQGPPPYNLLHVEHLMNSFIPWFGPSADVCFLSSGLSGYLETGQSSKPQYYYWTDISWETKVKLVPSRGKRFAASIKVGSAKNT